ncbi:protein FAM177B [Protobothrops mucrosquamatus]|uniref:protein FAM177B n=1 Tax=Protobothrops mucrosquamatus TaxID=103944 RepID=UPI00077579D1|nr:protein FAM177B [Protobothrops mucrosquamatus]
MMDNTQKTLKEEANDRKELGDNTLKENKSPGKIIYFANGETMEECSSEEEDVEESNQKPLLDTANLSWGNYLRSWVHQIVATAFFACEFLGGKFVTFLGLNDSKYQYAVDEYYRTQNKKNESDEDGEEMSEMKETTTSNEKYHLEMKQLRYGSITGNCNNIPFLPQKDTVANVNELEESGLQNLK